MTLVKVLCVPDLKLPEKTGCRQPGSSLTALTKSPLSGANVLWDSSYGGCVSIASLLSPVGQALAAYAALLAKPLPAFVALPIAHTTTALPAANVSEGAAPPHVR